ncbi:hypothetical protein OVY01_00815 [Robbsia sp. Bb-Pol-6]|uniref:Uncharacterized protein n=1 Tax=Robbsia betulipollinis TaxID=2981849 RepID=A0ABT3ZII8_9BURK|nr:hypothetical protein [Robbsia betulipollinis]MCY0385803.1 hypothetical protein [Robbsia betulipollinis]
MRLIDSREKPSDVSILPGLAQSGHGWERFIAFGIAITLPDAEWV